MSALVGWWGKFATSVKVRVLKIDHLIDQSIVSLAIPAAQSCVGLSVEGREFSIEPSEVLIGHGVLSLLGIPIIPLKRGAVNN
jgi:hypothetical protein